MDATLDVDRDIANDEDRQRVARFLAGDELAFTELVNSHRRQVYAVARRFTRNHEEADDLTQETFVKAYSNLKNFRGESGFKTWLLRITTNLSINYTKSARVARDSGDLPEDHDQGWETPALNGLMDQEQRRQLYRAIERLPPKQKQTLLLKTFQEMTCDQVAKVMGCSPGTVKANVFNALKNLKSFFPREQRHG